MLDGRRSGHTGALMCGTAEVGAIDRQFIIALKRFALLTLLWLVLTGNDPAAWPIGVVAATLGTAASLRLLPPMGRGTRLVATLALAPGFLARSLKGGLDVAWRAFHPRMPLKPGWILYPERLPPGLPRMSLGSEITLMPGTLAAGDDGRSLLVHCLDRDQPVTDSVAAEERRIGASIGIALEDGNG